MNDNFGSWVATLSPQAALFYADLIIWLHWLVITLVLVPVPLFWLGGVRGWKWTKSFLVRFSHLLLIGFIVVNTLLGYYCPLTVWENSLREQAGQLAHNGDFIAYWLRKWLYVSAPKWVFTITYTGFGALVGFIWWRYPPRGNNAGNEMESMK